MAEQIGFKIILILSGVLSPALVTASPGKNTRKDVSWAVKVKLLNDLNKGQLFGTASRRHETVNGMKNHEQSETEGSYEDDNELNEYRLETESNDRNKVLKNRRAEEISPDYLPPDIAQRPDKDTEDEKEMKLKLFRLMYETVRDNDAQTKTADKIKNHYSNSAVYEIGYIMADIVDKYEIMTDTAATVKRLFDDWKPVEHVNAYEQITNQAIEINQLIDLLKTLKPSNSTGRL